MFFEILQERQSDACMNQYWKESREVNSLASILENVYLIKCTMKEYLKRNKFIKFKNNGDDYIELAPNSKFFKKFNTVETMEKYIKEVLYAYIETLDLNQEINYMSIYKFTTITLEGTDDKPLILITI